MLQKIILVSTMTLVLFLFSCEEEYVAKNNKDEVVLSKMTTSFYTDIALDPNNPYDSSGYYHNHALIEYYTNSRAGHTYDCVDNFKLVDGDSTYLKMNLFEDGFASAKTYLTANGVSASGLDSAKAEFDDMMSTVGLTKNVSGTLVMNNIFGYLSDLVSESKDRNHISTTEFDILNPIALKADDYDNDAVDSLVKLIDLTALSSSSVPNVFRFVSIYNHSVAFWTDFHDGTHSDCSSQGTNADKTLNVSKLQMPSWVKTGLIGTSSGLAGVAATPLSPMGMVGVGVAADMAADYLIAVMLMREECVCPPGSC